jgi:isoleucyl-tRNA synthetase
VYLEGADQFRGWFQSSLLTAVAVRGAAPYRTVLTHGWTVDGEGKAMHKSLGNAVAPEEVVEKYGLICSGSGSPPPTIMWMCACPTSVQAAFGYIPKVRNTARYILGNLNGFEPDSALSFDSLEELDKWAVSRMNSLVRRCEQRSSVMSSTDISRCSQLLRCGYVELLPGYNKRQAVLRGKGGQAPPQCADRHVYDTYGMVRILAPFRLYCGRDLAEHASPESG